jgi:23S rRNA pseudouridine955/2504/2580 synthase
MKRLKFEDIIIAEDNDYIVINKPSGISSLHDWSSEVTIQKMAKSYCEDPQLCHRLDKETSGVMVIAKNPDAYRHLSMQFEHRTVDKVYHAVVEGVQEIEPIKVERPIYTMSKGKVRVDFEQGKPATTLFKMGEVFKGYTLMHCKPETGRMHQIRVHLASMQMPIVGDSMYGGKDIYLSKLKKKFHLKAGTEELPLIKRFALHAFSISYKNQADEVQYFEAPYPKDFNVLVKQLKKISGK